MNTDVVYFAREYYKKYNTLPSWSPKVFEHLGIIYKKSVNKEKMLIHVHTYHEHFVKIVDSIGYNIEKLCETMDQLLEEETSIKPSCKKGCSFCCHIKVDIVVIEGKRLLSKFDKSLYHKILKQKELSDNDRYTKGISKKDASCIFLKDGCCSIYEERPLNCRIYRVASDPLDCDAIKHPSKMVGIIMSIEPEMFLAAIVDKYGMIPMTDYFIANIKK
jgi:Fe-S-cluster containining protein